MSAFTVPLEGLSVQKGQYLFNLLNEDFVDLRRIIIFIVNLLCRKRYFQNYIAIFNSVTLLVTRFLPHSSIISRFQTRVKFDKITYLRCLLHILHKCLQSLSKSK
jgi:hypothetical protein